MRILLTMNLPYTRAHGGTNRSNRGLARALVARGHEVHVVVPALATPSPITHEQLCARLELDGIALEHVEGVDHLTMEGVRVHAVVDPSRLRTVLHDHIEALDPEWTLVSAEDPSQSLLSIALRLRPERVVYLAHTPQMFPFGPASLYPSEERTALVRRARAVMTISHFVGDYVRRHAGLEPIWCHPPHYGDGPFAQLGRFDHGRVLLMNASSIKGLPIVAELARRLPHVGFAAVPGYATTPEDRATLERLPNMEVWRNRPSLDDLLRDVRVLLMPSLWVEGFGMAAVDAMLRGIPVLTSDFGGLVEGSLGLPIRLPVRPIERFETRLGPNLLPIPVVAEQDVTPWLEALGCLTSDPQHYASASEQAFRSAHAFRARCSVEPLERELQRLAAEVHRRPAPPSPPPARSDDDLAAALHRRLAAWSPEQRALLVDRLGHRAEAVAAIPRDRRTGAYPLAYGQRRLWMLAQLGTEPVYNLPVALQLDGPIDSKALHAAIEALHRRHDALRTVVREDGFDVIGHVRDDLPLDFATVDEPVEDEAAWLREQARRPFDLARGPLWRVRLLRHGHDHHLLAAVFHHLIADGWSLRLLIEELARLYAALCRAEPSPLPEPAVTYADYARWQRARPVSEASLRYWKQRLGDPPPPLELPVSRSRPAVETHEGETLPLVLPPRTVAGLRAIATEGATTLFSACLAAFVALLHRYCDQPQLCVGVPVANRPRLELEGVVGLFVDTVVVRAHVERDTSFGALVGLVAERMKEARSHQDVPFERLVEILQPARDTGRSPLFQAMFVYESQADLPDLGTLKATPRIVDTGTAKFDLTLALAEHDGGLRGGLEYRSSVLPRSAMVRMLEHFRVLIDEALAAPTRPLARLPLMGPTEERRVLDQWGRGPELDQESRSTIHGLVHETIDRNPEAIAVVAGEQRCRYAELGSRASRLAAYLHARGAGPGVRVGVCLPRSLDLVVVLLAVLETGAAYVPLDPAYPTARLQMMLEDSQAVALVADAEVTGRLSDAQLDVPLVCPRRDAAAIAACSSERRPDPVGPHAPSHVIYTSGSTGRPKGVVIRHGSATARLRWAERCFGDALRCTLASTSVCFDLSVFELFAPLTVGGQVVLVDNALAVAEAPAAAELRLINTVPSAAAELLRMGALPPQIRVVNLAGEPLPGELVERLYATGHIEAVYNLYGPSEDTTYSTGARIERGEPRPPIGSPLPGTTAYVLDPQLMPVPAGLPGELYLGGVGLAQCYHQRPGLTAERFLPDPHRGVAGARMYRTGDRVRYRDDGQLEFLGRVDHQVKIRGFRIEPGEVELRLREHPAVAHALVLTDTGPDGQLRLVAYVVPRVTLPAELARRPRVSFPAEGLEMFFQRRSELEHFHQDIFEHRTYTRHELSIEPGDVVVDVGANVGTFTLFAGTKSPTVRVLSFEPVPDLCGLLRANVALNGVDARIFEYGLGAREDVRSMTFYPDSSGMSSFYADREQEREVLRKVFENERARGHAEARAISEITEDLIDARLSGRAISARTRRLSDVLREEGVERIDLLKIDVQKCEHEVLAGIDEADWSRIRQLVVEVHDIDGRLAEITARLERHGFEVVAEQDSLFAGSMMWNLYARRPGPRPPRAIQVPPLSDPPAALAQLRPWLRQSLPHFLVPAAIVPLPALPRTPNGKLDRSALPPPELVLATVPGRALARTELERRLCAIWCEHLGLPEVGIHESFFDLGGHSLLLVAVHRRLSEQLEISIPVITLFEHPTIAALASYLEDSGGSGRSQAEAEHRGTLRRQRRRQRSRRRTTHHSDS